MNTKFKLQMIEPTWEVDYPEYISCEQKATLDIGGTEHLFTGFGESFCDPKDTWDVHGGKLLAYIRAGKDVYNQLENYMIKYFCKPSNPLEATLTVDVKDIDKDILDLLSGESQENPPTFLKYLVGKWVVRTKSLRPGDNSYKNEPIFIVEASNDYAKFRFKNYSHCIFEFHKYDWDGYYLDDNWIEYKKGAK